MNVSSAVSDSGGAFQPRGLTRLFLTDFRNYRSLRLDCEPVSIILTGSNGVGKTNLLEAVSFLSPGRGLRRVKLSEISSLSSLSEGGSPRPWGVASRVETSEGVLELGTGLAWSAEGKERRVVRLEGENTASQARLSEYLSILWLTPQMDRIFNEAASSRRRFLDRLVQGLDPGHGTRVNRYEQEMRERARLLREGRVDPLWLGALEAKMAAESVAIAAARLEFVRQLEEAKTWALGRFPRGALRVLGATEAWLEEMSALEAEEHLAATLKENRQKDAETGKAAEGAHRCDLEVIYSEKEVPAALCSTGEQKALLISLIMAAIRLQVFRDQRVPILLLDEVVAHLDGARREALFEEILHLKIQAWMTGTDQALFLPLKEDAQHFHVENGVLKGV